METTITKTALRLTVNIASAVTSVYSNNDYRFGGMCVCMCVGAHMCMPQVQETDWLHGYSLEHYTRNTAGICEMKYHML